MAEMRPPRQGQRLLVAALYLAALAALGIWAHGGWPPLDGGGGWFYTAGIAIVVAALVTEPFYTTPAAALGNSAALVLVALLADTDGLAADETAISVGRWALVALGAAMLVISSIAIATHRSFGAGSVNRLTRSVATTFGAGYFLYGVVYVFSAYAAFADASGRLTLLLVGLVAFMARPLERVVARFSRDAPFRRQPEMQAVAVRDPGLLEVLAARGALAVGDRIDGGRGSGLVVAATESQDPQRALVAFDPVAVPGLSESLQKSQSAADDGRSIGYVSHHTSLNEVHVAASAAVSEMPIAEGHLVRVPIRDHAAVLFQITGATIEQESGTRAARASFNVTAQKLGVWNDQERRFDLVPWLPKPGAIVTLQRQEKTAFDADAVGSVPGSRYGIRYSPGRAVTHNTAILGVLGSGKTTLAQEVIARNIDAGIKV